MKGINNLDNVYFLLVFKGVPVEGYEQPCEIKISFKPNNANLRRPVVCGDSGSLICPTYQLWP